MFQSSFARTLPVLAPLVFLVAAGPAHAQAWERQDPKIVNKSGRTWSFIVGDCARPHYADLLIGFAPPNDSAGGESKISPVDGKSSLTIKHGETLQLYLKRLGPKAGGWLDLEFTREGAEQPAWSILLRVNPESGEVVFEKDWLPCEDREEPEYSFGPDLVELLGAGSSMDEEAGSASGSASEDDLPPAIASSLAAFASPERKSPALRSGATHIPSSSPGGSDASAPGTPAAGGSPEHSQHGSPGSGGSPEHSQHGSPGSGSPGQSQDGSPALQSPGQSRPPTPPLAPSAAPAQGPDLPSAPAAPAVGAALPA